jgi:hypothetical protein
MAGAFSGTPGSEVPLISNLVSVGSKTHFPLRVMPIRVGLNLLRSIAEITPLAEMQLISCSLLLPPQIIATLIN